MLQKFLGWKRLCAKVPRNPGGGDCPRDAGTKEATSKQRTLKSSSKSCSPRGPPAPFLASGLPLPLPLLSFASFFFESLLPFLEDLEGFESERRR